MKNWIGIDAHKAFCETAVLNNKGNLISRLNIITDEGALIEAILKIKGERYIVIEESSMAQWLFLTLKPYANKIVISVSKSCFACRYSEFDVSVGLISVCL